MNTTMSSSRCKVTTTTILSYILLVYFVSIVLSLILDIRSCSTVYEHDHVLIALLDSYEKIQDLEGKLDHAKVAVTPLRKKIREFKANMTAAERLNDHFQQQIRAEQAEISKLRRQMMEKDNVLQNNSLLLADLSCQQDDLNDEKDRIAVWRIDRDRLLGKRAQYRRKSPFRRFFNSILLNKICCSLGTQ